MEAHVTLAISTCGRLAQLGERRVRNAEARSSILLPSTNLRSPVEAEVARRSLGEGACFCHGERATVGERKSCQFSSPH
jgi:hypothetical protein